MRKGDQTRQLIVRTAEELFCARGFEATSVQDILDVIHGSKGGFYHHFVSKEDLLSVICRERAADAAKRAEARLNPQQTPLERLNHLFRTMLPFSEDDLTFMSMLMPLLDRPGCAAVRVRYQDALSEAWRPLLTSCLAEARASEMVWPVDSGILSPLLALVNSFWYEACLLFLGRAQDDQRLEPSALLALLTAYRRSIEALLEAPYGSIELISLEALAAFTDQVWQRMSLMKHDP